MQRLNPRHLARLVPTVLPAAMFCLFLLPGGCTQHKVEVAPTQHTIEVKPIYLTVDINIRVQEELDSFFEGVEKAPAPATQPSE